MTVQSPPFVVQNGSHSAALFRQASTSLVPQAGICLPAELKVTGTGAMSVAVAAGRAWVPGSAVSTISGQAFSVQGDYFALNDAPVTVTVATSDPTNPRIDAVYVAVNDSFYSGSLNTAVVGVVTGTPAVTPSAPPIPTNALLLATVAVAANATVISSGNVTDARTYAHTGTLLLPGGIGSTPTVAAGTSIYDPTADRFAVASTTGTWRQFAPTDYVTPWTLLPLGGNWSIPASGDRLPSFRKVNGQVQLDGIAYYNAGTIATTGATLSTANATIAGSVNPNVAGHMQMVVGVSNSTSWPLTYVRVNTDGSTQIWPSVAVTSPVINLSGLAYRDWSAG